MLSICSKNIFTPSQFIKNLYTPDALKSSISGIRGVFGKDLTLVQVIGFCQNFAKMLSYDNNDNSAQNKTKISCVIAQDTRPSSSIMSRVVSASLQEGGIDVYDLGVSPTPVCFRESRSFKGGIVITSSHNPLEWNGLKFITNGMGIGEKELAYIMKNNQQSVSFPNEETVQSNFGREIKKTETRYIDDAANLIGNSIGIENVHAIVDAGGGAAYDVAPSFLKKLGCRVMVVNSTPGESDRGPDPTSEKLDTLVDYVKQGNDNNKIGFAFDLDGDRVVVVRNGEKLSPDITLALGIAKSLELGYTKFAISIDTSIGIEKYIRENSGTVVRTKVGEANVVNEIIRNSCDAGGEGSSAGFILPEFNYCRDGILTAGLIASMMTNKTNKENDKIAQVIQYMSSFYQQRDKISIPSESHTKVMEDLLQKVKNMPHSEIVTLDGIKVIVNENTWVLVRPSNTEDIMRISAESANANEKTQSLIDNIKQLIHDSYEQQQARRS